MLRKYATRFQMVVNLPAGYNIVDWGRGQAGLYLRPPFKNDWYGRDLFTGKRVNSGTTLAASGTREELEAWLAEFQK